MATPTIIGPSRCVGHRALAKHDEFLFEVQRGIRVMQAMGPLFKFARSRTEQTGRDCMVTFTVLGTPYRVTNSGFLGQADASLPHPVINSRSSAR